MKIRSDRTRTATLWLKNGNFFEIPEEVWPVFYQTDCDELAAQRLSDATGLNVTIKTEILTTVDTR